MSRFIKPEAGGLALRSEKIVDSGDGVWYPVVGGFFSVWSLGGGIVGALIDHPAWTVAMLPGLLYLITIISYVTGTKQLRRGTEYYSEARYKLMPKIAGTDVEGYAEPLINQIYNHTIEHTNYSCELCEERLNVLRELVPNNPIDKSDILHAKLFIEERKKFELPQ